MTLALDSMRPFQHLPGWPDDDGLRSLVQDGIRAQKRAAQERFHAGYEPDRSDGGMVSAEALDDLLDAGTEVRGIATEREITNALPFNQAGVADAIRDRSLARLRRQIDAEVARHVSELFGERVSLAPSGFYWYPPGGYMGWHTNSRFPGWRIYVSHSEGSGESFFRYRDPDSGEVVTTWDSPWDIRLFEVHPTRLLWHCVYSKTNRFSLGYVAHPRSARRRLIDLARRATVTVERRFTPVPSSRSGDR